MRDTTVFRLILLLSAIGILFYIYSFMYMEVDVDTSIIGGPSPRPRSILERTSDSILQKRIVHLDLKGAAPRPEVYADLFALFQSLNLNAVLIEYEDMFPYKGDLAILSRPTAYNSSFILDIQRLATLNGLELIPLVQTFGHLEYALKHKEFSDLRENPHHDDTICPSKSRSIEFIQQMLTQIRQLHPQAKTIHIGADEAWHLAEDEACKRRLNTLNHSVERLKLEHVSSIVKFAKGQLKFEVVMIWNDMFGETSVDLLQEYRMGELVIPVIWGYNVDVTRPGYFPHGIFERYSKVFKEMLFAGAFKGANGDAQHFIDLDRYMKNLRSYEKLYHQFQMQLAGRVSGMVLTGWQRFSHHQRLCELLPTGIPSLIYEALYLDQWGNKSRAMVKENHNLQMDPNVFRLMTHLKCPTESGGTFRSIKPFTFNGTNFHQTLESHLAQCSFFGADLFREIENIRLIFWKVQVCREITQDLLAEINLAIERILPILRKYFYEDTVKEWTSQVNEQFTRILTTTPGT